MDADGSPGLLQIGQIALTARDVPGHRFLPRPAGAQVSVPGWTAGVLRVRWRPADAVGSGATGLRPPELDPLFQSERHPVEPSGARATRGTIHQRSACSSETPDHELWMAFFQDSEDNILAIMSEVRG